MSWLRSSYLARHWRGELSLPVSYWVNGFLGNLAILPLAALLAVPERDLQPVRLLVAAGGVWLASIAITLWQLVGVWRSAGRHPGRGGKRFWAVAARVMIMLGIGLTAYRFATQGAPQLHETFRIAMGDPTVGPFEIRLLGAGTEIEFSGGIPLGATDRLQKALEAAPRVHTVHLNSQGGRLAEARRMRDLIRQHGLDTYTATGCHSACTIAFLGGRQRFVNPAASLGFHASAFPGLTPQQLRGEHQREREDMVRFGVSAAFADRVVVTPHDGLWTPPIAELLSSGYASAASQGQFALSGFGSQPPREAVGEAIRQSALFDAAAEADPDAFEAIVDIFLAGLADGTPEGVVHARMREPLSEVIHNALPRASDEALRSFAAVIVEEMTSLGRASSEACHAFLFPDPSAPVDVLRYLDADLRQRELAASEAVIRTGMTGPAVAVDADEFTSLMQVVLRIISETHGEAAVETLSQLGSPTLGKADTCRHMTLLYAEVLRLPPPESAKVIRRLMTSG